MAGEQVNLIHVVFYRFLYVVRNIDKYMFCVHSKNAFLSKMKLSSDYEYICMEKILLVASMPAACMQSYLGPIAKNYIEFYL